MIGLSFLASRSAVHNALDDFMRDQIADNITDREKQILEYLNNQLQSIEKSSSKKCPECKNHFHILRINNVEIDCCKNCESLWFDPGELQILMNTADDITDDFLHAGKSKYYCPVCHHRLRKRSFLFPERVVVDECTNGHGVYFEKGELEQVFKITPPS